MTFPGRGATLGTKVNYNGFEAEKKKKIEITEATIDPTEMGLDARRIKEQIEGQPSRRSKGRRSFFFGGLWFFGRKVEPKPH